jgi:hypothetical protein
LKQYNISIIVGTRLVLSINLLDTKLHISYKYIYYLGPPGAPAGVYVESTSVSANSVRLIWSVSSFMNHGNPINRFHVEAEMSIYPDQWETIATGKFLELQFSIFHYYNDICFMRDVIIRILKGTPLRFFDMMGLNIFFSR